MNEIIKELLLYWGGFVVVVIIIVFAYIFNNWLFNKKKQEKGTITRQLISVLIFLIGALVFTIALPIDHSIKGQIISLIGIVLSAALALSSTTIIGNALAGLMNNSIKNFKLGDFIKIENNFGRVTKKGLFRTEIQTEDRNLTTLPNIYLASQPIKIVRDSGTIISTTVSLGYDINHSTIKKLLLNAAEESGLTEPYVFIETLGDFSITYRVHGILIDINKYFTTHSILNEKVIDNLHKNEIEIVSPAFMNQRQVNETRFIPIIAESKERKTSEQSPEEIVFDKAIKADKIEEKSDYLEKIESQIDRLKQSIKDGGDREKISVTINNLESQKEKLKQNIEDQKNNLEEHK
ncbi:MAG: mechanosensitive ion channel [Melioribacteraceae bacterium]|nr:mechanosensitive ion channel [Melioribacteraceae bacterium]